MLPSGYEKKSFLRFDIDIDINKLRSDFNCISEEDWMSSYWGNVHCSIGMLLLRGGNLGTSEDFFSEEIFDKKILKSMPYIEWLISEQGPFGKIEYAFIFKTQPNGVTLRHRDIMEQWEDLYRIHIPIYTNPGAYLLAHESSQHFSLGYAWSFDNGSDHGVVNGNEERVHLILDAKFCPKMKLQLDNSKHFEGQLISKNYQRITNKSQGVNSYIGDTIMKNGINTLLSGGASIEEIATILNTKKIPSKSYPVKKWNAEMISQLMKD
jgi:hypothetical protein